MLLWKYLKLPSVGNSSNKHTMSVPLPSRCERSTWLQKAEMARYTDPSFESTWVRGKGGRCPVWIPFTSRRQRQPAEVYVWAQKILMTCCHRTCELLILRVSMLGWVLLIFPGALLSWPFREVLPFEGHTLRRDSCTWWGKPTSSHSSAPYQLWGEETWRPSLGTFKTCSWFSKILLLFGRRAAPGREKCDS